MKIVVLADTHMPRKGRQLPEAVTDALQEADLIVHLGDFTHQTVVDMLTAFAPLCGVHGNNDSDEIRARFPARQEITLNGHRLTLIHGDQGGRTALAAARAETAENVVLFGHSHQSFCAVEDGRLLFNPGSPTDRRWGPHRSFGILEIASTVTPSIVLLT